MTQPVQKYFTPKSLANLLCVNVKTVYRMQAKGLHFHKGFITLEEFEAWRKSEVVAPVKKEEVRADKKSYATF